MRGRKGPQTKTALKVESMLDPFHKMDASQEGRKTDSDAALLILVLFGFIFPTSLTPIASDGNLCFQKKEAQNIPILLRGVYK